MLKSRSSSIISVILMEYCSNCGSKLEKDDYFCPKCGVRTKMGLEAGVSAPSEEWRETFARMGKEMERAFTLAGKEIEKAFKTARENIQQTTSKEVVCSNCGQKSPSDAIFCYSCGKKLRK
jgi:rRNA maturation endonuclease Nob1